MGLLIGLPSAQVPTYTATHYVAPFASVSGASNDYDDLGESAFDSATSSSSPTTLGTAMAWAGEQGDGTDNVVECAEGLYIATDTIGPSGGLSYEPDFSPTFSGTASNPIIFYAKYPAATNYGSTSLYSEVRKQTLRSPTMGPNGRLGGRYQIFDGFFFDENHNLPPNNGGIASLSGLGGGDAPNFVDFCEFRRCAFYRTGADVYWATQGETYEGGDVKACLHFHDSDSCKALDNRFEGGLTVGAADNQAAIMVYTSSNHTVEHNYFNGNAYSIYHKDDDSAQFPNSGTFRFNHFNNCGVCNQFQNGQIEYSYNLHTDCDININSNNVSGRPVKSWNYHHNTFVLPASGQAAKIIELTDGINNCIWRDNIVYHGNGLGNSEARTFGTKNVVTSWDWTDWTLNNNCYYTTDSLRFFDLDFSTVSTLAAWRTDTGQEANSFTTDPEFVGGGDYRLADNGQDALTGSSTGGPVGCYVTGSEDIGVRSNPDYS